MKFVKKMKVVLVCIMVMGIMGSGASAQTYTVQPGDVLWKIAEINGTTSEAIVLENNLSNPNLIFAGQELLIGETMESPSNVSRTSLDNPLTASVPDGFRVTIIGSGIPELHLDKLGSSVLVEYNESKFLVDCGYESMTGVMRTGLKVSDLTNMFFTHQHADHNADFWAYFIGGWDGQSGRRALTLAGPSVQNLYDTTLGFFKEDLDYRINVVGSSSDGIRTNVNVIDFVEETESFEIDGVKISVIEVPHTIKTYAYKFEAGGQSVVITGDMTYNEQIASFSAGADIMVIDALQAADFENVPEAYRPVLRQKLSYSHLLNEDIAKVVGEAKPKNLILTHWIGNIDIEDTTNIYKAAGYEGQVIKGEDGIVVLP